jgi:hypothetical protein
MTIGSMKNKVIGWGLVGWNLNCSGLVMSFVPCHEFCVICMPKTDLEPNQAFYSAWAKQAKQCLSPGL